MRNLKRVLSLTLATAMLFGMMVMGAGAANEKKTAADLTDSDKITNKEAVTLLVDLGIVEGKSDGSYSPAETVNRATMAKLITVMMMGDVDQDLFKGTATDLKDIEGHWAEGYIKYCYSNKFISGDGAGSFFPDQPVTVVQAAKMLLVAIGYQAKDRKYESDSNWSVNIMKDAQSTTEKIGATTSTRAITKGLSVKATDPLTRDNAAQMIFNTLFVQNKKPDYQWDMGTQYIQSYGNEDSIAKTVYNTLTADIQILTGISGDGNSYALGTGMSGKKMTANAADIGKMVVFYKQGATVVSSAVSPSGVNSIVTVPGDLQTSAPAKATFVTKWLTANGLTLPAADVGAIVTDYTYVDSTDAAADIDAAALAGIGNFTTAYVIDHGNDGIIDVLVKTTKSLKTVTGEVKTKTTDGKITVSVPGVTSGYVTTEGYEDLTKNDKVLAITFGGITYITKCETVEGKVTGYKGTNTLYIDGTAYTLSDCPTAMDIDDLKTMSTKTVKAFLDENGNLLTANVVSGSTTYNVAFVLGYDSTGSTVDDTTVATARLLLADGTMTTVDVAKVTVGTGTGAAADASIANTILSDDHQGANVNYKPVTYAINDDGKYELTTLGTTAQSFGGKAIKFSELADDTITPNKAKFASDDFSGVGNAGTMFAVADYSTSSKKMTGTINATGIAKAPKFTDSADGIVIDVDGVAALVFIVNGTQQDTSSVSNYAFIPAETEGAYDSTAKTYTYADSYLDGAKVDLVSKVDLSSYVDTLFKASLNDDGVVVTPTPISSLADAKDTGTGVAYNGGVVSIDTATNVPADDDAATRYYTLADDAKVYVIDDGVVTEVSAADIQSDKTDTVVVLGASDMATASTGSLKAQYVYITKESSNANTASVQAYVVGSTGVKADKGSAITATGDIAVSETITIAATTASKVGVKVTAADGATVSISPAERTLVGSTLNYAFEITIVSEDGTATETITATVKFTGVTAS